MVALGALPGRVVAVAPGPVGLLVRALAVVPSAAAEAAPVEVVLPAVHEAVRVPGGRVALFLASLPSCVTLVGVPCVGVPALLCALVAVFADTLLSPLSFGVTAATPLLTVPVAFLAVVTPLLSVPVTLLSVPVPFLSPSQWDAGGPGYLSYGVGSRGGLVVRFVAVGEEVVGPEDGVRQDGREGLLQGPLLTLAELVGDGLSHLVLCMTKLQSVGLVVRSVRNARSVGELVHFVHGLVCALNLFHTWECVDAHHGSGASHLPTVP